MPRLGLEHTSPLVVEDEDKSLDREICDAPDNDIAGSCVDTPPGADIFVPSKGRNLDSLLFMAATGVQPKGEALPSLLPSRILTKADHVGFACRLNPARRLLRQAIPTFAWNATARAVANPSSVLAQWEEALGALREWDVRCRPLTDRWRARLPPGHPSAHMHLALIQFFCKQLEYPDVSLADDLARGMPLVGSTPAVGVFQERQRPAATTVDAWRGGLADRNAAMVQRVVRSSDTELSRLVWDKTLQEAEKGWVTTPVPLTEHVAQNLPLSPRFGIWEQHGNGPKKVRVIDDFKASKVNDLLALADTCVPETLDVFLAMLVAHGHHGPATELLAYSVDFAHAYKQVAVDATQADFATIVLSNYEGAPHVATLKTQPFGSRRAPANWGRVAAFLKFALERLFSIWVGVFVDDLFSATFGPLSARAFSIVKEVCAIFGFLLSPEKEQSPRRSILLLGAQVSISANGVTATLPATKAAEYRSMLLNVIATRKLSPDAAAKLRGKLGFAQSLLFGKYGRAMMHDLTLRQYSTTKAPLTDALIETAQWWLDALQCSFPRELRFRYPEPVTIYTDAQGAGHVAAVMFRGSIRAVGLCHTHVPQWMMNMPKAEFRIYEFEMTGVALGVALAVDCFPGAPIIICCDNKGAIGTLIRGSCKTQLGREISSFIWRMAAEYGTLIWVEFVTSPLNISDEPSRCCGNAVHSNHLTQNAPRLTLPGRFVSAFESNKALTLYGIPEKESSKLLCWECPLH